MSALQQFFSLLDVADPYRAAPAELRELQLEALRERSSVNGNGVMAGDASRYD